MIKAIIFDLGDTLILNSKTKDKINKSKLTYHLFLTNGLKSNWEDFLVAEKKARDIYDYDYNGKVERFESGFFYEKIGESLGIKKSRKLYAMIDDIIQDEFMKHMQFPKQIHETLEALKKEGIRLVVISNGHKRTILRKLKHGKLDKYFMKIFISYELGEDKSTLTVFKKMLLELKVSARECLMVGDRLDEDMYAKKVGIWTALVTYVPKKTAVKDIVTPNFELPEFSKIKEIVRQINEGVVAFE